MKKKPSAQKKGGKKKNKPDVISERFIKSICARMAADKPVRRNLPEKGRIHIDRQLPFLCVYRKPSQLEFPGTEQLVTGEPSYLKASGEKRRHKELALLVENISKTQGEIFGAFFIIEIWAAENNNLTEDTPENKPSFRIFTHGKGKINSTVDALESALLNIKIQNERSIVEVVPTKKIKPPDMPNLIMPRNADNFELHVLGIEVRPIYLNQAKDQEFPVVLRRLRQKISRALKKCFFDFMQTQTKLRPPNFQVFGRRSFVNNVWKIDRQLAEISNSFDFLLLVSPTNAESAWKTFKRKRFNEIPKFTYRRIPIDPVLVKRKLFNVPIERIEDPTLIQLFREQQSSIARKLTMLSDRGTKRFLYGGLQLFGSPDNSLIELAGEILARLPSRSRDESVGQFIDAKAFSDKACEEIDYYRKTLPDIKSRVELRDDISGILVSDGNVLLGRNAKVPVSRIEALLQHEIGTHMVTYINGGAQPLQQLRTGLPEYDSLQEGIGVLAEYLVGGLTRPRMRIIAARVFAISRMLEGATFVEVFRELHWTHHFNQHASFLITMRVFRGGGYVKDFVYLKGLIKLLEYLRKGGLLETLLIGKFGTNHIPIVKELLWRKVLKPPLLLPRYLDDPQCVKKLDFVKKGITILEMVDIKENRRKHENRVYG